MKSALLRWHVLIFVLINAFLAAIDLVFTPSALWFPWITGSWGMGLIIHAFAASGLGSPTPTPSAKREPRSAPDEPIPSDSMLGHAPTQLSDRPPPPSSGATDGSKRERSFKLSAGDRLADRFVIERALGVGGMGEVYLGRDLLLDEPVAIKTLSSAAVSGIELERFRREVLAARRISHPNVVRIHDLGEDGALTFISMEYIDGESLGQRLRRDGALPLAQVKQIALQVCDALSAAHAVGVTHRDLKPDNILLDSKDQVHVIDFGLARLDSHPNLTSTGTVMGTPDYMAPEQVRGQELDARTDIYALGCVLHHAITGAQPFPRESALAVGIAHVQEYPPALTDRCPDVPDSWDEVVLRALEKQPEDRYQTAAELRQALQAL